MPAMRARDVIIGRQRLADAHGNRFFTDIKMSETRHKRARIEVVDLLFKEPDHEHPPVHVKRLLGFDFRLGFGSIDSGRHFETPDIRSNT